MAATNGPDNSLERIIVLYQQELHNKLQSLNTIQQRYQLLNSQLQQLNKQEDQSYAVVRKATALRQKSLALIDDIKDRDDVEILTEPDELEFDKDGYMEDFKL